MGVICIDRLIDTVFFRERHKAEQRLARVAASLPHSVDADAVDDMLVAEPVGALHLASGALFKRDERGYYAMEAAMGWPAAYDHIEAEALRRENAALRDRLSAWEGKAKKAGLDLGTALAPG